MKTSHIWKEGVNPNSLILVKLGKFEHFNYRRGTKQEQSFHNIFREGDAISLWEAGNRYYGNSYTEAFAKWYVDGLIDIVNPAGGGMPYNATWLFEKIRPLDEPIRKIAVEADQVRNYTKGVKNICYAAWDQVAGSEEVTRKRALELVADQGLNEKTVSTLYYRWRENNIGG